MTTSKRFLWVLACVFMFSCNHLSEVQFQAEEGEELSAGQGTIFDTSENAFSLQIPTLSNEEGLLFFVGNSLFNQNWVTAPASTTARDGLGPLFNARSCSGCHFKDGRGRAPEFHGELNAGHLIRLSIPDPFNPSRTLPDPHYGGQLQDQAINGFGVPVEGGYEVDYLMMEGKFADGSSYELRKPMISFVNLKYGPMDAKVMTSPRVAPQMVGLGFLEAIPEADLLALADPEDRDNDGISGRPNYILQQDGQKAIGRFGWKANQQDLEHQVAGAFLGDMGITSDLKPSQNWPFGIDTENIPNGGEPEIDADDLQKVVLYSATLAVPARRNWQDPEVLKGKQIFMDAGCAGCHIPKFKTGTHPTIDGLSHQVIRPFTDLLLHDMGEGLADGRPDHEANGQEWRTPPLWGIGLFAAVNDHTFYLHDGRARNLSEAILWHGGEAEESKNQFVAMSSDDRQSLLQFLNSL
ncbi:di-heme oxidoredictase family protein [Persicobacter psychrovividus]|uniref:Thiol oxidoreductase n=1 Tax=Persicobacter psychrovividus TaxID=387638 RepID=A0ABN6LCF5_9BACT|nr:thiol oxidoreductase [Persicobacter psychrovividus]